VPGDVGHVVRAVDQTARRDEIAVAAREVGVPVVRVAGDLVGGADGAVDVREQAVRELLCLGEREVLRDGVERRAEDYGAELGEAIGPVTQGLALDRSTRRGGLRVPPEQHP
jgi:hypothetical protein